LRRLVLRTVLPALLAVALFSGVVFFYLMPSFSRSILDQKRLMIRELTESAWNILARFEAEEEVGRMTRAEAQTAAIAQVRSLHYGQEHKDYFWINDMHPHMIVHPYRPDLEGTDISAFADPEGKLIFTEMVRVVRNSGAGYVDYRWQWKDDSRRIVPKLSYVKGFEPWGWILGTGVYIEDVNAEVRSITHRLTTATLLILLLVVGLLTVLLRASFQAERGRLRAAGALLASEEKYRTIIESAGESILMLLGGDRLFANPSMLHLLGYTRDQFAALDIADVILPTAEEHAAGSRHWEALLAGVEAPARYEAEMARSDDSRIRVMLSLSRIQVQGRAGFMAIVSRVAPRREMDIQSASTLGALIDANRRTPVMASLMLTHGTDAMRVSNMLTANADALIGKCVELVIAELGEPPAPFDIVLMGSLGRGEISLYADQDNGIIYQDVPPGEEDVADAYFRLLGQRLSETLDAAGYRFCEGGIMTSNPKWVMPLSGWRAAFTRWIHTMEAEDLLQAQIFFDFRGALEQPELVVALRRHLLVELGIQKRFFFLLARNVLLFEPPLNAFGSFILEEKDPARATFDSKGVMAQIVDYVRVRALQYQVFVPGTLRRLDELVALEVLKPQTAADTAEAFTYLMDLRMHHQARKILSRMEPDNRIEPAALGADEQNELKRIFVHIKALQAGLDHEFKGS